MYQHEPRKRKMNQEPGSTLGGKSNITFTCSSKQQAKEKNTSYIEGPIRRPERGEWMGTDKNSSRMMNSAMPQNHNHEFHTSLSRSRSQNGPTNPRNKSW
jgi:hypothetical protein